MAHISDVGSTHDAHLPYLGKSCGACKHAHGAAHAHASQHAHAMPSDTTALSHTAEAPRAYSAPEPHTAKAAAKPKRPPFIEQLSKNRILVWIQAITGLLMIPMIGLMTAALCRTAAQTFTPLPKRPLCASSEFSVPA